MSWFGLGKFNILKLRPKSAHRYRSKTGHLGKFLLFIGIVFLIILLIDKVTLILNLNRNTCDIILAFGILFLGSGSLIYFLSYQFAKLAEIAEEIENEDESKTIVE